MEIEIKEGKEEAWLLIVLYAVRRFATAWLDVCCLFAN